MHVAHVVTVLVRGGTCAEAEAPGRRGRPVSEVRRLDAIGAIEGDVQARARRGALGAIGDDDVVPGAEWTTCRSLWERACAEQLSCVEGLYLARSRARSRARDEEDAQT